MNRAIGKQMIFVIVLAVALVASFGVGLSLAADGETIPHGGYSDGSTNPMTDACLQCHDVHEAAGEYVLMREPTVTGVCSTCHNIYLADYRGGSTISWPDPGYPSEEAPLPNNVVVNNAGKSTSAFGAAYEITLGEATTHEGHRLGMSRTVASGDGPITYADGAQTTNANYIPGGSLQLTRIVSWVQYLNGTGDDYLQPATASCDEAVDCSNPDIGYTNPAIPLTQLQNDSNSETFTGVNAVPNTESATSGLYCASCHAPHGEFGNALPNSVYEGGTVVGNYWFGTDGLGNGSAPDEAMRTRGKILTNLPNHDQTRLGPVSIGSYISEAGTWCGRCHDKRLASDLGDVRHNNHPSEFCLVCHGIYNATGTFTETSPNLAGEAAKDFPHVGAKNLLQAYPDELCLRCHGTAFPIP